MPKKLYKKIKNVPLYPCHLGVLVSEDYKKVNKFLKRQGMPNGVDFDDFIGLTIEGAVWKGGEDYFCVYIILDPKAKGFTHGLVSHEVRHAVNAILDRIGQRLDPSNDEAEAYLSGWVTDVVYKVLHKGDFIKKLKIV